MEQQNETNMIKILSEEEMYRDWDKLDHKECCQYQAMSVQFIKDHIDDIDWNMLSINKHLTFGILEEFTNKINWVNLCMYNSKLADNVIYHFRTKMVWQLLLSHMQLNLQLLIVLSEIYRKSKAKNRNMFWKAVSRYQKFDYEYVDAYKKFIDFKELSNNPNIDEQTIEDHLMKMDVGALLANKELSPEFLARHRAYLNSYFN